MGPKSKSISHSKHLDSLKTIYALEASKLRCLELTDCERLIHMEVARAILTLAILCPNLCFIKFLAHDTRIIIADCIAKLLEQRIYEKYKDKKEDLKFLW